MISDGLVTSRFVASSILVLSIAKTASIGQLLNGKTLAYSLLLESVASAYSIAAVA